MNHLDLQCKLIESMIDEVTHEIWLPSITSFNEQKRVIAPGTSEVYGPFRRETAPHMVEIAERFHPDDPCNMVTVKKSVQSCFTFTMETIMAYVLDRQLGSIGFYTASLGLAEKRSKTNIDPMIDETEGLADKVQPFSTRNKRKQGDTTFLKEFIGNNHLAINTYNSIASAKSSSYGYMFLDELDEMPEELANQGSTLGILKGRTRAKRNYKQLAGSTPTMLGSSNIHILFIEGDQRYYFVPCPLCGKVQILTMMKDKSYGLTFDVRTGTRRVIENSVRYVCQHCQNHFTESKKQDIMIAGKWKPTAEAQDPKHHSYHINGLMSPEGMMSWLRICTEYAGTNFGKNVGLYKDFVISVDGECWEVADDKVDINEFKKNCMYDYTLGTPHESALLLTVGVDVQGDRIEVLVQGRGRDEAKSLCDYKIFYGDPSNHKDECWMALLDLVLNHTYVIRGRKFHVTMCAIDAGFNPKERRPAKDWDGKSHAVYQFVGYANRMARKAGRATMKQNLFAAVRGSAHNKDFSGLKEGRTQWSDCPKVYMVNTWEAKALIYSPLSLSEDSSAIIFPKYQMANDLKRGLGEEIIAQFLSEQFKEDPKDGKMKWMKNRERNEVLDTWIYADAAAMLRNVPSWSENRWKAYEMISFGTK